MNKRKVEEMLPTALDGLKDSRCGIRQPKKDEHGNVITNDDGTPVMFIDKNFRGQIAAFGAAVTMGSFKSAIAFFGEKGGSEVERQNLVRLMYYVTHKGKWMQTEPIKDEDEDEEKKKKKEAEKIVEEVIGMTDSQARTEKEKYLNASLAIKLALNAFHLE